MMSRTWERRIPGVTLRQFSCDRSQPVSTSNKETQSKQRVFGMAVRLSNGAIVLRGLLASEDAPQS